MFKRLTLIAISLLTLPAYSESSASLQEYYHSIRSLQGEFVQTTRSDAGELLETSRGLLWVQRPDRFRWSYSEPFEQEIIADGQKLWVYDLDLEQVTVRPLSEVLGIGPALLLSGDYAALEENFTIQPETDGWLELIPKRDDWDFQSIRLQMEDGVPHIIEVDSGLGQMTRLKLSQLQRNIAIDPAKFKFTPPDGVDVIAPSQEN